MLFRSVIAFAARISNGHMIGTIIAFVYGYGGMFASGNAALANVYPVTASLGGVRCAAVLAQKEETAGFISPVSSFHLHSHRQTQIDLKSTVFTMLYQHFSTVCKYDLFDNE